MSLLERLCESLSNHIHLVIDVIALQRQAQRDADSGEPRQEDRRQGGPNIVSRLENSSSLDLLTRPT